MAEGNKLSIVCIGEILWDALPDGLFLGGAPLNVCLNLHQLDENAAMVSRIGDDRLGDEAKIRIQRNGLGTQLIQIDATHETGFVQVTLDDNGDPEYEIVQPVAWDFIDLNEDSVQLALKEAWAVVFGTLAQRISSSLEKLLELDCMKVLDMNLRAPHYQKEQVLKLVKGADFVKMNIDELLLMQKWCSLPEQTEKGMRALASRFDCAIVCVTCGPDGARLLYDGRWFSHPGFSVKVADAVGAGDAFLAALLHGLRSGKPADELLPLANAAGAFVASRSGANPGYSVQDIETMAAKSAK